MCLGSGREALGRRIQTICQVLPDDVFEECGAVFHEYEVIDMKTRNNKFLCQCVSLTCLKSRARLGLSLLHAICPFF